MKKFKLQIVLFLVLAFFWVIWNNSFKLEVLIPGLITVLLAVIIFGNSIYIFEGIKFTPKGFMYSLWYILVFVVAMIKSNLDVIYRVLSPKLPINPGIVRIETKLKSPFARLVLANSITLTPGTFVVEMKEQYLWIHWIDVCCEEDGSVDQQKATEAIAGQFEKILLKIYE